MMSLIQVLKKFFRADRVCFHQLSEGVRNPFQSGVVGVVWSLLRVVSAVVVFLWVGYCDSVDGSIENCCFTDNKVCPP